MNAQKRIQQIDKDNLPFVGEIIFHQYLTNRDGTPQRFRVTSITRRRDGVLVGLKRGLYQHTKLPLDIVSEEFYREVWE